MNCTGTDSVNSGGTKCVLHLQNASIHKMSGLNDEAISNEHHKKTNLIVDTKKLNESKTDFWILGKSHGT